MSFIIDKQTFNDLAIFGRRGSKTIYNMFNSTKTLGGSKVLDAMFRAPLSDADKIRERAEIIEWFMQNEMEFPYQIEIFDVVEQYLDNRDLRTKLQAHDNTVKRKVKRLIGADVQFDTLHNGVVSTLELLNRTKHFFFDGEVVIKSDFYHDLQQIKDILLSEEVKWVFDYDHVNKLSYAKVMELDEKLRYGIYDRVKKLLSLIYNFDVYIAVATVAKKRNFHFANVVNSDENLLNIEEMYHPFVSGVISNTLSVSQRNNIIFLTGANMAGKSTFMKTFGVVVFLAHLGFPIPAESMTFSVKSGMYTTINLPDNLSMGYSHFYAEVLRIKKVAEHVNRAGNLVIVFDELFRGTNVKDAYDATLAVTEAFASNRSCTFMISTHIIEAGDELKKRCDNINFIYLPTLLQNGKPVYPYKLAQGITNDRHGMVIIKNEKIVDILHNRNNTLPQK